MELRKFIDSYWHIFIAHICEFHRLEGGFIETYQDDLNWMALSQNKVVSWDAAFIKKYESRWFWPSLAMNSSIEWNDDLISTFTKRLDTYYLVRNINLPLTEEFILKHLKKSHFVADNIHLTPELKNKYKDRLLPIQQPADLSNGLSSLKDQDLDDLFENWKYHEQQIVLYKEHILPKIKGLSLETAFANKFDYSQKYYYLSAITLDIHGLTPSYKGDSTNPFESYNNDQKILELPENVLLKFVPDSGREGPDRIFHILRSNTLDRYAALIVSENIISLLRNFKLPRHRYFKAQVELKKLSTTATYYVLQFDENSIYDDLKFGETSFVSTRRHFTERGGPKPVDTPISSYEEMCEVRKKINSTIKGISSFYEVTPSKFPLNSSYDLYTLKNKIIVNEYVKQAVELVFPNQVHFSSAQLLNIKMDQNIYNSKKEMPPDFLSLSNSVSKDLSTTDNRYKKKKERLEINDKTLDEHRIEEDDFKLIQIRLNVIFPIELKRIYREGMEMGQYKMLLPDNFYIENQFADSYPETYKALIIAENGFGDSIGLLLKKESDFQLDSTLYEFLHETGDIKKYRFKLR
jgi:hypothetical protein